MIWLFLLIVFLGFMLIFLESLSQYKEYKIFKNYKKELNVKDNVILKEILKDETLKISDATDTISAKATNTEDWYFFGKKLSDLILIENGNYYFEGKLNTQILTPNELNFFKKLKLITDKYELLLFPRIRMADIIRTDDYSNFNKIKSRKIDFTICNQNTEPILFIELDDPANIWDKTQQDNNKKKDYIMKTLFKKVVRVKVSEINENLIYIEKILNKGNADI